MLCSPRSPSKSASFSLAHFLPPSLRACVCVRAHVITALLPARSWRLFYTLGAASKNYPQAHCKQRIGAAIALPRLLLSLSGDRQGAILFMDRCRANIFGDRAGRSQGYPAWKNVLNLRACCCKVACSLKDWKYEFKWGVSHTGRRGVGERERDRERVVHSRLGPGTIDDKRYKPLALDSSSSFLRFGASCACVGLKLLGCAGQLPQLPYPVSTVMLTGHILSTGPRFLKQ